MHWQKNGFAVQPLMFVTKGWPYDTHYRTGFDETMAVIQDWVYQQASVTFRRLPTKTLYLPLTAPEYEARPNFYRDVESFLNSKAVYDSTGQRIEFCNWKRLYVLGATGTVRTLENMAGRSSWGCPAAPENPMEGWGPGVTGGPSSWATELLRGNEQAASDLGMEVVFSNGQRLINMIRGAILHELLHCLGIRHSHGDVDGPLAWLSPMGGWWFFGAGDANGHFAALLPREIAELRGEREVSGPFDDGPKAGSHFFT